MDPVSNSTGESSLTSLMSFFDDEESRWQAVRSRDAGADGFFFYAVKTTKIFCRPTCKARLARRANVRFYETVKEAETAGFRACKRCKPSLAGFMPEEAAIGKIKAFVASQDHSHPEGSPTMSLGQMARKTGLSKWHFHRVFKKHVGVTPVEYLKIKKAGLSLPVHDSLSAQVSDVPEDVLLGMTELLGDECEWAIGTPLTVGSGNWSPMALGDFLVWPSENTNDGVVH